MRQKNKSNNKLSKQPRYRRESSRTMPSTNDQKPPSPRRDNQAYNQGQANSSKWLRSLPSIIAAFVILGSIIHISRLDAQSTQVRVVTQSNSQMDDQLKATINREVSYRESFKDELSSSWLNQSKLTVRSTEVIDAIVSSYPEIAGAEIRYGLVDRTPILHIVLREPHIIIVEDDRSLVLDRHGIAFAEAPDEVVLPDTVAVIEDSAPMDAELGDQVLPLDTVEFINQLRHQFQAKDLTIQRKTLPAVANELHVRISGDDYSGKFDITGEVRLQAGAFFATREQLKADDITPREYIDVRVIGRAYYR